MQNFKLTNSYFRHGRPRWPSLESRREKSLAGEEVLLLYLCSFVFFIYNCICHWMYLYLYLYDSVFVFLYVFVFVLVYTHGQSLACEGGLLLYNYVLIFCKFV